MDTLAFRVEQLERQLSGCHESNQIINEISKIEEQITELLGGDSYTHLQKTIKAPITTSPPINVKIEAVETRARDIENLAVKLANLGSLDIPEIPGGEIPECMTEIFNEYDELVLRSTSVLNSLVSQVVTENESLCRYVKNRKSHKKNK